MHLFDRFRVGDKEQRNWQRNQLAYFTAIPDQLPIMQITDGAWGAAHNLWVIAELKRPFTDKPRMILPSKKRCAVHDLLLIMREGQFQRQSD